MRMVQEVEQRKSLAQEKKVEQRKRNKLAQEKKTIVAGCDDIVFEILARLPARSVGRFRCVSKSWLSITTNSTYVQAHIQHSRATARQSLVIKQSGRVTRIYLASAVVPAGITFCKFHVPIESSIKASCDGLLCVWVNEIRKYRIFNPLTGRSVTLPPTTRHSTCFLAFYFNHSTSEYRLLALNVDGKSNMLIVGKNSRKQISCPLPAFCNHSYTADVEGRLHWLAWKQKPQKSLNGLYTSPPDIIMTFDKEAEVYGLLSLLPLEKLHNQRSNLVNFKGDLGLWVATGIGIDLWIMEKRWIKKYSSVYYTLADLFRYLYVPQWVPGLAICIGDEELLIDIRVSVKQHHLIRWHLKSRACVSVKLSAGYSIDFLYMESLVDPNNS